MKQLLIIIPILLVLGACGTKVITPKPKLSQDTRELDEFLQMSTEERHRYYNKQKILDLYQQLRERERREGAYVKTHDGHYIRKRKAREGARHGPEPKPTKKVVKKPTPPPPREPEELRPLSRETVIEVEQNLTMFCMAKRKDRRFREEGSCPKYTQAIFEKCKEDRQQRKLKNIVYCVKSRLR